MKIVTDYDPKPIPLRQFDWTAVTDNYEPGHTIGYGRTEQEAIADLRDNSDEFDYPPADPDFARGVALTAGLLVLLSIVWNVWNTQTVIGW